MNYPNLQASKYSIIKFEKREIPLENLKNFNY